MSVEELPDIRGYRILGRLALGGRASVYAATQGSMGELVAIKVSDQSTQEMTREIRHEIGLLALTSHPGVISLLESGEWEGRPWFSMPLLRGSSLSACLRRVRRGIAPTRGLEQLPADPLRLRRQLREAEETRTVVSEHTEPLSAEEVPSFTTRFEGVHQDQLLRWVMQLAEVLVYLHQRGIAHGDIKPDNLFVEPDGGVVLIDFGMARVFSTGWSRSRVVEAPAVAGTAAYAAPERILDAEWDGCADLYALGCILYEILTGRVPFRRSGTTELELAHLHEEPTPPGVHQDAVPPQLERLTLELLHKDPRQRSEDGARGVVEALRSWLRE